MVCPHCGCEIAEKRKRSSAQNRRYWALLTVGAESIWGDVSMKDTLHEEIAHLLLGLPPCEKLIELGADLTGWDYELQRMEDAA